MACKECAFANYEGNEQVGCELNRLEKFRQQDCVVDAYDDDKKFAVISQRICNTYRTPKSLKGKPEEWAKQVRKDVQVEMGAILLLSEGTTESGLDRTLSCLEAMTIRPTEIVLVANQDNRSYVDIYNHLKKRAGDDFFCKWKLVRVLARNEDGSRVDENAMLEMAIPKLEESAWFTVLRAGDKLPKDFIQSVDIELNDELTQCVCYGPLGDWVGFTSSIAFYKHLTRIDGPFYKEPETNQETGEIIKPVYPNFWTKAEEYTKGVQFDFFKHAKGLSCFQIRS